MPRIHPITADTAEPATRETLDAIKVKAGMIPNLHATFAHAPAVLNGYLALADALTKGVLTAQHREIISLTTAQANGCQYCLSAHTLLGKNAGLSEEAIHAARRGVGLNATDQAIAELTLHLVNERGHLTDQVVAAARTAGLNDAQIIEIVANVALNILTNFTNNVARTQIDFPIVELASAA